MRSTHKFLKPNLPKGGLDQPGVRKNNIAQFASGKAGNRLFVFMDILGVLSTWRTGLRMRPHAEMFMRYISHLDIDLSLFVPFEKRNARKVLSPYRDWIFANRIFFGQDRRQDKRYFVDEVVAQQGGNPGRVLVVSSDVESNWMPNQTLTVEAWSRHTKNDNIKDVIHGSKKLPKLFETTNGYTPLKDQRDDYVLLGAAEFIHDLCKCEEMDVASFMETYELADQVDLGVADHPAYKGVNFLPSHRCTVFKSKLEEMWKFADDGPKDPLHLVGPQLNRKQLLHHTTGGIGFLDAVKAEARSTHRPSEGDGKRSSNVLLLEGNDGTPTKEADSKEKGEVYKPERHEGKIPFAGFGGYLDLPMYRDLFGNEE